MASEERRLLIETKARDAVGPLMKGAGVEETQKDQAERYLRDARERWASDIFHQYDSLDEPRIFLTDGLIYWGYEIGPRGGLKVVVKRFHANNHDELASFLARHVVPSERRYKAHAPDDLIGELLSNFALDLETIYRNLESDPSVQTKIALWRNSLHGAGIVPPDSAPLGQASLFVRHTVLVVAARILKKLLQGSDMSQSKHLVDDVSDGFPAWLAYSTESEDIVKRIATKLDEYQWRGDTRDHLKDAYHKLIAKKERKEFGEYYTPDWLASKVVDERLDEPWMDRVIRAASSNSKRPGAQDGLNVLDPACGSGTFLFHAARRLLQYIRQRHPRKLRDARRIITKVVVGIDIHPIAVEMAEATLEMALPPPDPADRFPPRPQVFLGDAMQATRRQDLSSDVVFTESAQGTRER